MDSLQPFDALLTPQCDTTLVHTGVLEPRLDVPNPGSVAMLEAFVDRPLRHENLTVFPVIAPHGPVLPFLLSTEAQEAGVLTVRERGDAPEPLLLARNNSLHPLLLLAGEPLPGENQGRLVERSILLGRKSVTQIPAPPLERGDWVSSGRESQITEWLEHFPELEDQVGLLVFQGMQMMGLEALGAPNLYTPLHRRLLVRFIKKALACSTTEEGDADELEAEAQHIVGAIGEADRLPAKRVGVGEYCSLGGRITGGDLTYQGHLVHLTVRSANPDWTSPTPNAGGAQCC